MFSFRDYIDYAEQLYVEAQNKSRSTAMNPYIIGSILISWMAVESFINNIMQDFAALPEGIFTVHERGFLQEKQVRFANKGHKAGTFYLENKDEYKRLEDKILFLIAKAGKKKTLSKGSLLWQRFEKMKEKRNALSHPKRTKDVSLILKDAQESIDVAKNIIEIVSREVWNKQIKW